MTGQHRSEFPAHIADSPFQRLAALIAGETPGAPPIDLAVGNPRHPIPPFVADTVAANVGGYGDYPAIRGTEAFRASVADWLDSRFTLSGLIDPETGVLPLNGSREGLYFATIGADAYLKKPGDRPVVLVPNPGYPAYSVGAFAVGAEIVPYNAAGAHGVMPDWARLGSDLLDRTIAVFVASPSNPQGALAGTADWAELLALADAHNFMVFSDECYSEIYRTAVSPPNPSQAVAAAAFCDEAHVVENRRLYDAKFALAEDALGDIFTHLTPPAGFFLWLDVSPFGDDPEVCRRMWTEVGVRAVPGSYLGAPMTDGPNPGQGFVRIALVQDEAKTEEALGRLADLFRSR